MTAIFQPLNWGTGCHLALSGVTMVGVGLAVATAESAAQATRVRKTREISISRTSYGGYQFDARPLLPSSDFATSGDAREARSCSKRTLRMTIYREGRHWEALGGLLSLERGSQAPTTSPLNVCPWR